MHLRPGLPLAGPRLQHPLAATDPDGPGSPAVLDTVVSAADAQRHRHVGKQQRNSRRRLADGRRRLLDVMDVIWEIKSTAKRIVGFFKNDGQNEKKESRGGECIISRLLTIVVHNLVCFPSVSPPLFFLLDHPASLV